MLLDGEMLKKRQPSSSREESRESHGVHEDKYLFKDIQYCANFDSCTVRVR